MASCTVHKNACLSCFASVASDNDVEVYLRVLVTPMKCSPFLCERVQHVHYDCLAVIVLTRRSCVIVGRRICLRGICQRSAVA